MSGTQQLEALYQRAYRRGVLVYVITPEPGDILVPHSTPIHVPSR